MSKAVDDGDASTNATAQNVSHEKIHSTALHMASFTDPDWTQYHNQDDKYR